jgi:fumarylacetoacetate (FAA) hydrolase
MKFISYLNTDNEERLGLCANGKILDFAKAAVELGEDVPTTIRLFLKDLPETKKVAEKILTAFTAGQIKPDHDQSNAKILAPVPNPPTCRDAYAFRQHVAAARKNRGMDMVPEFDQFPIFYFTNHHGIIGPGDVAVEDDHLQKLDFELEVAVVIGKKGRNIESKNADSHVFGLTIMNDFSARLLQTEEMLLSLGPAKGKDFATAIGPWLVTLDELEPYKIKTPFGDKYDLEMKAFHNGKQVSQGNMKDMNWTFAEIIERASYGVDLYPGDVIGSGTVGTGCYMELNGTWAREAKEKGKEFSPVWLKNGDTIELEVTGLGRLTNRIVKSPESHSLLKKKKNV